jgi:hypothetical protein
MCSSLSKGAGRIRATVGRLSTIDQVFSSDFSGLRRSSLTTFQAWKTWKVLLSAMYSVKGRGRLRARKRYNGCRTPQD